MKEKLLLFIFLTLAGSLLAQITITNATFPAPGDTLRTASSDPNGIELLDAGENLIWNFTNLDGPAFENIVRPASEGAAFDAYQDATIVTGQAAEAYYRVTDEAYEFLGFSGGDPLGFGLDVNFRNNPPLAERTAPLNYGDEKTSASSVFVAFAWDDLPAFLTDSLGAILPIAPDSIGVEVITEREEMVDAWGTVNLPVGSFEVLRMRRQSITDNRLMAHVFFFGWQDVTDLLPFPLLGQDTMMSYIFYNDESKEEIAVVNVDAVDETPLGVTYKFLETDPTTSIIKLHEGKPNIHAYPNPAINDVRIDVVNVSPGRYNFQIYNILGMKMHDQAYNFTGNQDTININLSSFKRGTYLYSLSNEQGKALITRRLVIIRP